MSDKECIYREDAVKILRGDCIARFPTTFAHGLFAAADALEHIPTAPVREVVTCGECVHLGIKDFATGYCKGGPMCGVVKPWDYCSHGVRKADMRDPVADIDVGRREEGEMT